MNEIQIKQMLYLMQEINNNLIMIKHFIGYSVPREIASYIESSKAVRDEKDEVIKTLARINDDMIKESMY